MYTGNVLEKAFSDFTAVARTKIEKRGTSRLKTRMVYLDETVELRAKIDELEQTNEFQSLLDTTFSVFSEDGYHGKSKPFWLPKVRNFFRQSGFYIDIFEEKDLSQDYLLGKYVGAFQARHVKRTYLVPLDGVRFGKEHINCGSFQIQQFTSDELSAIFGNRVRKVFYERTAVDVEQLQRYWFLSVTEEVPARKLKLEFNWPSSNRVKVEYTSYPICVQEALQLLVTYHWQADYWRRSLNGEDGWGFKVPVVVHIDDDLRAYPGPAPDLSLFEPWTPVSLTGVDEQTGERVYEVDDEPEFWIQLESEETENLESSMQALNPIANSVRTRGKDWPFVEVALGFFVKAFFSNGLEQLLWHMTVLEALLGKKGQSVEERLAPRVASILGRTSEEAKTIKKEFLKLYDLRSDLVHGRPFKSSVDQKDLLQARQLTRQIVIWFLYFLHHVVMSVGTSEPHSKLPAREELLILLDIERDGTESLKAVLHTLPKISRTSPTGPDSPWASTEFAGEYTASVHQVEFHIIWIAISPRTSA